VLKFFELRRRRRNVSCDRNSRRVRLRDWHGFSSRCPLKNRTAYCGRV
jgi:hypothetical protein